MEVLSKTVQSTWRFSIPPLHERERCTFKTIWYAVVATLPLIFAAYLRLRHPGSSILVKLLVLLLGLPIISHLFLKRYVVAVWESADGVPLTLNHINFLLGMASGVCMLKFIEVLFLGTEYDYQVKGAEDYRRLQEADGLPDGTNDVESYSIERPAVFPGSFVPLEVDIIMGIRGIGYNWGLKESNAGYKALIESHQLSKKPLRLQLQSKWSHIRRVALAALTSFITMDICDSIIKDPRIFPPAGRLGGGPVIHSVQGQLGWAGPVIITFATGILVFTALQCFNSLLYLVNLLLTSPAQTPITVSRWEPLPFNRPYQATSLAAFWSTHWHAFVRRTYITGAYKPVHRLSSFLGWPKKIAQSLAIIATFALSGLLHEGCLESQRNQYYDVKLHLDYAHPYLPHASADVQRRYGFGARRFLTVYAFTVQAFFILFEDLWLHIIEPKLVKTLYQDRKGAKEIAIIVGGPVRSFLGWLWTMSCMMYSGYYLCDLWHTHGLINALATPRLFSYLLSTILTKKE